MGVYSIKEISLMVDMSENTMRTYLGHYSFAKYHKGRKIEVSNLMCYSPKTFDSLYEHAWSEYAEYLP